MNSTHTFKIVLTSLFAALVCVATMFIRIPSPTGGFVNLGDGIVLLSAFLLGPVWGTAAAGIGSMLADLLAGYPAYAVGTLVIKAAAALTAGAVYRRARQDDLATSRRVGRIIVSGLCGEALMVLGYFVYTALCLGYGAGAAAEIPGNLAQAGAGIAIAAVLTPVLLNAREIREMLEQFRKTDAR